MSTILDEFKQFAESKGFYVATKDDMEKLVATAIDTREGHYPLWKWLDQGGEGYNLEDRIDHPRGWYYLWKACLKKVWSKSIVICDSPEINAWTIWTLPDEFNLRGIDWYFGCGSLAFLHMGFAAVERIYDYRAVSDKYRKLYGRGKFFVPAICVKESHRGRGYRLDLLMLGAEFFDKNGMDTYVECHTLDMIDFLNTCGYEVVCQDAIPHTMLHHSSLVRKAQKPE